jgi:hypothetical protein
VDDAEIATDAFDVSDVTDTTDTSTCPQGQRLCGATCVDISTSADHCGACDSPCSASGPNTRAQCQQGICERTCTEGWTDPNGDWVGTSEPGLTNGCEDRCTPAADPTEICDGLDNDCNGEVDDGVTVTYYLDEDGDGYGVEADSKDLCAPQGDFDSTKFDDCNDDNDQVHPGAQDTCNGINDDCVDNVDPGCNCVDGTTMPGYSGDPATENVGICKGGTATCTDGSWGHFAGEVTPESETCDGNDNNCDGQTDEDWPAKGDTCSRGVGACLNSGIKVCKNNGTRLRCNATPGSPDTESCDNVDNDCNGQVDDNLDRLCGSDVGACSTGTETCSSGSWGACQGANGPTSEVCDGDDNNCNGQTDEGQTTTYQPDLDGDGFGDANNPVEACAPPPDYISPRDDGRVDCNDNDPNTNPGATEICDNRDNNCDSTVDDANDSDAEDWCDEQYGNTSNYDELECDPDGSGGTPCCEQRHGDNTCDFETDCSDGSDDDDGDGMADCNDPDCTGRYCDPAVSQGNCVNYVCN